ncbi:helix-turn-helix domain-containing protein [Parashewanella spongiae]|nr:helix-turn-helix transcriptional regulator [Parashewanella spongiae]MCL1078957.1 helix-turn-helix domain-containing protein [Parashewanella spongiae]
MSVLKSRVIENYMDIKIDSEQIKALRVGKNWTQQHLAELCGISLRTIQRIEKSGITSSETVAALSAVFGIAVDRLKVLNEENDTIEGIKDIKTKVMTLQLPFSTHEFITLYSFTLSMLYQYKVKMFSYYVLNMISIVSVFLGACWWFGFT